MQLCGWALHWEPGYAVINISYCRRMKQNSIFYCRERLGEVDWKRMDGISASFFAHFPVLWKGQLFSSPWIAWYLQCSDGRVEKYSNTKIICMSIQQRNIVIVFHGHGSSDDFLLHHLYVVLCTETETLKTSAAICTKNRIHPTVVRIHTRRQASVVTVFSCSKNLWRSPWYSGNQSRLHL